MRSVLSMLVDRRVLDFYFEKAYAEAKRVQHKNRDIRDFVSAKKRDAGPPSVASGASSSTKRFKDSNLDSFIVKFNSI